jgi:hypothetical protein
MRLLAGSLLAIATVGCGQDDVPPDDVDRPTWYQDVAPILARHCMTCHQEGDIAPFALTDYEAAREMSARMLHEIDRGAMPPFDAREDADCTPRFGWVDDPRLSAADRQTLARWIDDGHPLGEVADIPAIPETSLAGVTRRLTPAEGWAASGDRDQFICYVLDPGNTQLEWLTGLQVNPDNALVVHHAVITELAPGPQTDLLVAQRGIGRPFDCGTMATPSDFVVHIWTPGNQPMQTSDEIAVPVVANAKLVMQIHYHPAGLAHAPDRTSIDLRFSRTWPRKMYFVTALGNAFAAPQLLPGLHDRFGVPEFRIPKDVADHAEHMRFAIPDLGELEDVRLFSVNPHMHYIGTKISATIERPAARGSDPKTECLANGGWNFDWQRTYTYDAPLDQLPSIAAGDVVDIKCEWNNTLDNPFVHRMLADAGLGAPVDVFLGEETTQEMCLEIFGIAIDAPTQPGSGKPAELALPRGLAQMQPSAALLR